MIHELVLHTSKSHQNIVGTQANYESTKYSNEKSKSNKVLRTTAKMMHELLPDRKKVMETLRARRMIRLLPERYDLNRPLVFFQWGISVAMLVHQRVGETADHLRCESQWLVTTRMIQFDCLSHEKKKLLLSITVYWLFNRDPENVFYNPIYNHVV